MASDDERLRLWCAGDLSAGDELWARRIDVTVDQRLLALCAKGDPKACERFAARYLAGLDARLVAQAIAEGRVAALCERMSDDLSLLARYAAENATAGEALFARHYPALDRFVSSKVSDFAAAVEIVQETFLDLARQHLQIQKFRPFMFRVAANKVGAWYTKRFKRPVDTGTSGISHLPESAGVETREQERLKNKLLLLALQHLSLNEQMVIELYTWEDFTAEEVAEMFGYKLHDVRHMLRNAKAKMRSYVEVHGMKAALAADTAGLEAFLAELQERARGKAADWKKDEESEDA